MQLLLNPETSQFTDAERSAILGQLERMLAHPHFNQSRRFPALLRFVVQTTLEGHGDLLKERTLGVEIFKKRPHYDTGSDPIVRVTAAELRKRIALYYAEAGHESELRLTLPPGSYVPRFDTAQIIHAAPLPEPQPFAVPSLQAQPSGLSTAAEPLPRPEASPASSGPVAAIPAVGPRWFRWLPVSALLLCLLVGGLVWWKARALSPLQAFWGPILSSPDPVLFCVADQTEYTDIQLRDAAQPSHQSVLHDNLTAVVIDDLAPIADIAGVLRQNGKNYTVRGEGATTLNDLRAGPSVFIGAFDNAWTLRLLKPQRFHFANDSGMTRFWIVDTASDKPTPWLVDRQQQLATNIYRDYAIVSRFLDGDTGKPSVVVAGIGRGGTIAAGEFLTNTSLMSQLATQLRSPNRNVELVLSTQIIGGQPGTPRVEAIFTW